MAWGCWAVRPLRSVVLRRCVLQGEELGVLPGMGAAGHDVWRENHPPRGAPTGARSGAFGPSGESHTPSIQNGCSVVKDESVHGVQKGSDFLVEGAGFRSCGRGLTAVAKNEIASAQIASQ
jgi:hypothetical protein